MAADILLCLLLEMMDHHVMFRTQYVVHYPAPISALLQYVTISFNFALSTCLWLVHYVITQPRIMHSAFKKKTAACYIASSTAIHTLVRQNMNDFQEITTY